MLQAVSQHVLAIFDDVEFANSVEQPDQSHFQQEAVTAGHRVQEDIKSEILVQGGVIPGQGLIEIQPGLLLPGIRSISPRQQQRRVEIAVRIQQERLHGLMRSFTR
ncbi:hypothetical protein [Bradyrhizobium sp. Leaf401]|uniref:hypothetical protein n=1 Tax=Bradyrhizobium sp. Leaf401 TaxID=2876564 RepID=UPI001E59D22B|nr:hypothetical protein [Bradyrhizobium sp. Leaf401]